MLRLKRLILSVFYVALFFEIFLGFPIILENRKPTKVTEAPVTLDSEVQKLMTGIHLAESREGDRDWELFAEEARGLQNADDWELARVKIQFYSQSALEFTVTGEHGKIDSKTKDVKIFGHVVTTAKNGYIYKTDEVRYIAVTRSLFSPEHVTVIGPPDETGARYDVEAGESNGDIDHSIVTLQKKVTGTKVLAKGKKLAVFSDSAKIFGLSRQIEFSGEVSVHYDTFKIEGEKVTSQMIGQGKDPGTALTKVFGAVKLVDQDKYATADELEIHPETNRIVLKGHPRLIQGEDEVSGEQITLIDSGRKIQVDQLKANVENLHREEKNKDE